MLRNGNKRHKQPSYNVEEHPIAVKRRALKGREVEPQSTQEEGLDII